jgi:uncharacterized membrane protein YcaP (DUF421 family)
MESVLRVAFVYFLLMVTLRLIGKRELGRMSPFELVLLMLIPELFQQALVREDFSMTNATISFFSLVTLVFATSLLAHRYERIGRVISGSPTVLAQGGQFLEDNMNRERVAPDEVYAELRKAGFDRLRDAKWIVLEDDGKLSVVPMRQERVVRRDDEPTV